MRRLPPRSRLDRILDGIALYMDCAVVVASAVFLAAVYLILS